MTRGIYFLDKNTSLLSDIESFFVVNDTVCYRGGCGLLQQAIKEINGRDDIDIIVISDNLIDATCVEALKALLPHKAKKIVALRSNDEVTKEKIAKHAVVITYPYSCNLIEETIRRMGEAPSYSEDDLDRIAESNVSSDNPFVTKQNVPKKKPEEPAKPSFQERLKKIQLNRYSQDESRVLPQKVIAIHSQKGGVGKSTVSRELAIATSCIQIKNDAMSYRPKVCLCDFDFDACDIAVIMGLENTQGIITWCEDINYEAARSNEPIEDIRFTENVIKERYLQLHESGVYVLCAPMRKTDSFKIETGHVEAMIENLKLCDFDVILMDTGPNILDFTLTALSRSDEIYAICNCDMLSAKRIDGMISDVFSKMRGFNFGKISLLVNHLHEKNSVTPQELSKALNLPLIGEIPYYPEIVDINNEGISVFLNRRKATGHSAEFANAFKTIARHMIRSDHPSGSGTENGFTVDGLDSSTHKANFNIFRR